MVQQVDNAVQRKIQNRTKPARQPVPVFPVSERRFPFSRTGRVNLLQRKIEKLRLSARAKKHYLNSWREQTQKAYAVFLKRWNTYCVIHEINPFKCELKWGIEFLSELFDEGYAYNSLNIARCAFSTIVKPEENYTFGANPTTCLVLKGVYNARPPTARYTQTWDTDIVLKFLCELSPLRDISLKQLMLKFTVLFLLVNCQRIQTVSALDIGKVFLEEDMVVFGIADVFKHSKAGRSLGLISCKKFDEDPRVCIWRVTREYIPRTEELRPKNAKGEPRGQLVISHVPPYKPASKNTIARWTREVLAMSGVCILKRVKDIFNSKVLKFHQKSFT